MSRAQLAFTVLALVVVFSMVAGVVATAVVDELTSSGTSDPATMPTSDDLEDSLRQQVEENPDDPQTIANLANILSNKGEFAEAITLYERALAMRPDEVSWRLDFAQTLVDAAKPADAELQFQKVINAQPNDPYAHFHLAELYQGWDPPRTADAAAEYTRVIEVGPDTFVADQSREKLQAMGLASPAPAGTPSTPQGEVNS
jgi:cytochrome c-type biogenesis protein CcmH/NrfG